MSASSSAPSASSSPASGETTDRPYQVLVSNSSDGTIGVYEMDRDSGEVSAIRTIDIGDKVGALAPSGDGRYIFAGSNGPQTHGTGITVLSGIEASPSLSILKQTPVGQGFAYLCVDPSSLYVVGADYHRHGVSLFRVADLVAGHGEPVVTVDDIGHAHATIFSADGRFLYVSALGDDRIYAFALKTYPTIGLDRIGEVTLPPGFGPRHIRLAAEGTRLLALSELQGRVAVIDVDAQSGELKNADVAPIPAPIGHLRQGTARGSERPPIVPFPTGPDAVLTDNLSHAEQAHAALLADAQSDPFVARTLQDELAPVPDAARKGDVWAADMHLSPDERFVYTSERSTSRLLAYRHGTEAEGQDRQGLAFAHAAHTETQPRGFRLDPAGRFLLACGERSPWLSVYAIDPADGALTRKAQVPCGRGANWIEIL